MYHIQGPTLNLSDGTFMGPISILVPNLQSNAVCIVQKGLTLNQVMAQL